MGIALIAVGCPASEWSGSAWPQTTTPQGIAAAFPRCATGILDRSPTTQRVFTAYGTGGYVIYRTWPRGSVYEYGESISLGTDVFDDYLRIAAGATTAPTALQLLTRVIPRRSSTPKGALTRELASRPGGRWSPTTTGCSSTCAEMDGGLRRGLHGAGRHSACALCEQEYGHAHATDRRYRGIATGKSTVDGCSRRMAPW